METYTDNTETERERHARAAVDEDNKEYVDCLRLKLKLNCLRLEMLLFKP